MAGECQDRFSVSRPETRQIRGRALSHWRVLDWTGTAQNGQLRCAAAEWDPLLFLPGWLPSTGAIPDPCPQEPAPERTQPSTHCVKALGSTSSDI